MATSDVYKLEVPACRKGESLFDMAQRIAAEPVGPNDDFKRNAVIHQLCGGLEATNEALAACQAQAAGRIGALTVALRDAIEVIKTWHNMDGADNVWDIYYRNAPEMKRIREALEAPRPAPRTTDADVLSEALDRISGGTNDR